jgi:PAS domain-containing protein
MPETVSTGNASREITRMDAEGHIENIGQAGEQTSITAIGRNIGLPIDEYAILLPTEIPRSAVVISGSEALPNTERIPFQVFAEMDFLKSESTAEATSVELQRLGLEDVFSPDPDAQVSSVVLIDDDSVCGFLVCKLLPGHSLDHVRTLCHRRAQDLCTLMNRSKPLVTAYERGIMRIVFPSLLPAVITDDARRIVAANSMLCELAGRTQSDIAGKDLLSIFHLERDLIHDAPPYPEFIPVTTPLYIKTQALFFVSELRLSRVETECGARLVCVFQDLLTDQRTGNSNIQLVQKLSSMVMTDDPPQTVIRRVTNILTSTLDCDLVCIMRRKDDNEMIVTPYLNRSLETLRANLIVRNNETVLEPFFSNGTPVFCSDVETSCPQESFFRQVLKISRFAFIPAGRGTMPEYALLMAWSHGSTSIGPKALPLLRVVANLMGTVLVRSRLVSEIDQEKDILRRYTRLTAGREVRMADLKRENARLRELIMNLSNTAEE